MIVQKTVQKTIQKKLIEPTHETHRIGKIFLWLLIFVPISWLSAYIIHDQTLTFIFAIIALIPLARIIGYSTKEFSLQTNPAWGGLINATFGNMIELFIAILALSRGLYHVVQASIVGSIIGNILLLIGLSVFFGGLKYKEQKFNKDSIGISATMLIIAIAGLAIPTVYALTVDTTPREIQLVSDAVAIVLAITYIAGLVFSLITHKHLFDASDEIKATKEKPTITKKTAILYLCLTTIAVAIESELLVGQIEHVAISLGITQMFIGAVIIAIVTNIAEKTTAIHFALENKLDIALEIGLSSAIQIALFVVPILVVVSDIMNYNFSLVMSLFQIISMLFAVMIVNYLSADGKCNWLEGVQLLSVYLIIAIAFFFI
ncbi:MAG: calcium/proton exchanger [Candidatus Woesearchaeota archaeon]|jgi:Ca2+:H+ antiporter